MSVDGRHESHERRNRRERVPAIEERSEEEAKSTRAGVHRLRSVSNASPGNPSKARPVTAEGHGGKRGRPTNRYLDPRLGNGFPNALAALKGQPTS
jgi:hypothetical protein